MSTVHCDGLGRVYGSGGGMQTFTCEIDEGEFFALLGPSGCGKTTTLRLIAGLERPDHGRIFIGGRDVTALPPEQRNAAMVFQSYALFPHLDVFENVAFGLRARKRPKSEIALRVADALGYVQLEGFQARKVTELSGGQQQRVALARALAVRPAVLLLDEPLSNLDAALRHATRTQLAQLQRELKLTTIYVTHDQEEALELAHRIAVIKDGRVEQIDTPQAILKRPATPFVRSFLARYRPG